MQYHHSSAFFWPVTAAEVGEIIASLKNTASNINEIAVRILKNIRNLLSNSISFLINTSIASGVFPLCLKRAKIIPIYKKGDTKNMSNYRPIALLPTLSKVFESCIANMLIDFLGKADIVYDKQFGFVKGRSTTHALVELTEYIYGALIKKSTA